MRFPTARSIALALLACLSGVLPAPARAGIHVSLEPDSATVQPGDTVTVRLTIFQAESQFSAFDAFVAFDPARFAYVASPLASQVGPVMSSACGGLFHEFTPHADNVEIHLSFLTCPGTYVTGPGEIYRVRLRVLAPTGPATLTWPLGFSNATGADSTEFYRAGFFVRPVDAVRMVLFVGGTTSVGPRSGDAGLELEPPRPNPYRGSGPATLRFTLAGPARVGFAILDAQGRRVVSRAPESFAAGAHSLEWNDLRLTPGRYLVAMNSGRDVQVARAWVVIR